MSSAHRHKVMNKYRDELDTMFGDDIDVYGEDSSYDKASQGLAYAGTGINAITEILAKKAEADKIEKAKKDKEVAEKAARDARSKASDAANAADIAALKSSADPNNQGLKIEALQKKQEAQKLDQIARELEIKAGTPTAMTSNVYSSMSKSSDRPWYFWPAVVGGVVVGGAVLYKVVSSIGGGGSTTRDYMRGRH